MQIQAETNVARNGEKSAHSSHLVALVAIAIAIAIACLDQVAQPLE